jgi:hypothetical protein
MDTVTKTTLAEMVIEALNAKEKWDIAIADLKAGRLHQFPKSIAPSCTQHGVHTFSVLSLVMQLAGKAGRPIHEPVWAAARWLRRNYPEGFGLDLYRFSIQPGSKPGSAELFVEDEDSDSPHCVAMFYADEIGHEWQGYFEFWAARNLDPVARDWVLMLPEEY